MNQTTSCGQSIAPAAGAGKSRNRRVATLGPGARHPIARCVTGPETPVRHLGASDGRAGRAGMSRSYLLARPGARGERNLGKLGLEWPRWGV